MNPDGGAVPQTFKIASPDDKKSPSEPVAGEPATVALPKMGENPIPPKAVASSKISSRILGEQFRLSPSIDEYRLQLLVVVCQRERCKEKATFRSCRLVNIAALIPSERTERNPFYLGSDLPARWHTRAPLPTYAEDSREDLQMVYQIGSETTVFSTNISNPAPDPQVVGDPVSGDFAILWSTLGYEYSTTGDVFSSTGAFLEPFAFTGTPNPTAIAVINGD